MINFFKVFLLVFIKQIAFLFLFGYIWKRYGDAASLFIIAILIGYLIMFFKILKKTKIAKFQLFYIISWILSGFLISYLLFSESFIWNYLPTTGGMFSGLEYILIPIIFIIYIAILSITKLIIYFINKKKEKDS